jgi:hypothetical protein
MDVLRLRPFLEKNHFLEKFSRSLREKNRNSKLFFFTFGILITKMTPKMYTKLAYIEINDEILSKVGGIQKNLRKNCENVKNEVKIQKLL